MTTTATPELTTDDRAYFLGRYYAWQHHNGPLGVDISPELFLSIYRFAAGDTLRVTSRLSAQFEALRRYVDFVAGPAS